MAGLSLKDLRKGRVATFITKMEEGVKTSKPEYMFTKVNGRKLILRTMQYNPGGRIVFYEITKHKKVITDLLSGTTSLPNLKFTDITGNETVSLSEILKTEEFSGRVNKSDINELIYSAAIAARFMKRGSKPIVAEDVEWVIRHMNDTNEKQRFGPWKTENEQKGVFDQVYWSFAAPIMTVKTLSKAVNRKGRDIHKVVESALLYANSQSVKDAIALTGKNNKSNTIEIKAVGTISKSERTVDVLVLIDGKKINLNQPKPKTSKVVGGGGYQKQQDLWMWLTSTEVSKSSIDSYSKMLAKGIPTAIYQIYFDMSKVLNRKFTNLNDPIYSALGPGIQYLTTLKDPLIRMPSLTSNQLKLMSSDNLRIAMAISNKKFSCSAAMVSGMPTLIIKDNHKGQIFLKLTFRKLAGGEDQYINVLEKGPAFDLITNILK